MVENSRIAAGNETGISGQHNNLYSPDDNVSMASSQYNERVRRIQDRLQNMQFDIEADRN